MTDCDKCKEYDKEKHYCPVFCNVINDILTDTIIEELEDIKTEIKEWYWQSDKQELAKDPCVVDAMTDLFIRTINEHISELKGE